MRHPRWFLPFVIGVLAAACHHYTPVDPADVAPGDELRVFMTRDAAAGLAPVVAADARRVDGRLVRWGERRIVLRVPQVAEPAYAAYARRLSQEVRVAAADIVSVEVRELDRLRTGALAAAVAGAVGFALVELLSGESRPGEPTPPEPPQEIRRAPRPPP